MGLNQAKSEVFRHSLGFGLYFFLKTAHNDSLRQCLASSRNKTQEKKLAAQILAKQAKISPEITFFTIFSSLVHYLYFKLYRMIARYNEAQNDIFFCHFLESGL